MLKSLTLSAAIALGLGAPAAYAADKPVYGVLMKTLSNPFWGAMEKGVDEGAKKADVDISLMRWSPTRRPSRSSTPATRCCRKSRRR
jgi:ABC-type sugar transport system substrate-binding protein